MLYDALHFLSAVVVGIGLAMSWRAFKTRIRFHLNIGEHIAEDPSVLRRLIVQLKLDNSRLRNQLKRKDCEVRNLRLNLCKRASNESD